GLLEEQRRPRREDELIGDGAEAGESEEPERPVDEETSQAPAERLLRGRRRRTGYEPRDEQRRRDGAEPEEHHHRSPRQDLDQEAPDYEARGETEAGAGERHALAEADSVGRGDGGDERPVVREERPLEGAGQRAGREERGERSDEAGESGREGAAQQAQEQDASAAVPVAQEPRGDLHDHVRIEERRGEQAGPGVGELELAHDGRQKRGEPDPDHEVRGTREDEQEPYDDVRGHGSGVYRAKSISAGGGRAARAAARRSIRRSARRCRAPASPAGRRTCRSGSGGEPRA